MNYLTVYLLSIIVGVGMIIYGKQTNNKAIKILGLIILLIDILVPMVSFIAGFSDGLKSNFKDVFAV